MSEDFKTRYIHSHTSKRRLIVLAAVLIVLAGIFVWLYLDNQIPKGTPPSSVSQPTYLWLDLYGEPRATDATPRLFCLWEFRSDDTVRCITVKTVSSAEEEREESWGGPWLHSSDELIDVKIIGGELVNLSFNEKESRGETYQIPYFTIFPLESNFGYDVLMDSPPYLHILTYETSEPYRLISIGSDPQSYFAQTIDAIAVPLEANVTSIHDYHPYRHITLGEWDIFYYDTTDITGHRSIHINYEPAGEASSLDWAEVDAMR